MIVPDVHISPGLALWITSKFQLECYSASYLNLQEATDNDIFFIARAKNAVVITKDDDFVSLLLRNGSPPKVIWLTCGNTSNALLKEIFEVNLIRRLICSKQLTWSRLRSLMCLIHVHYRKTRYSDVKQSPLSV